MSEQERINIIETVLNAPFGIDWVENIDFDLDAEIDRYIDQILSGAA